MLWIVFTRTNLLSLLDKYGMPFLSFINHKFGIFFMLVEIKQAKHFNKIIFCLLPFLFIACLDSDDPNLPSVKVEF